MAVRLLAIVATLTLAAVAGGACGAMPLPCDVTIAAVPPDSGLAVGDAIPDDFVVLVAPPEVDRTATAVATDQNGQLEISIKVTGDGVARLANYTGTHVGGALAIAINGTVVSVPFVNSAILDGALAVSPATEDQADFAKRFAGCVR